MEAIECFCTFSPKSLTKLTSFKSKNKPSSSSGSGSPRSPTMKMVPPRREREEELREVFRRFDSDRDGKISPWELRSYMGSMGECVSYEDAEGIIKHVDSDNDSMLDYHDFVRLMESDCSKDGEEELKAAFRVYEWEGTGRITARSLQRVLGKLGDPRSYEECAAIIGIFDSEGKGEIAFHQFQQMMMTPPPRSPPTA